MPVRPLPSWKGLKGQDCEATKWLWFENAYDFGQMRESRGVVAYCLTSKTFSRISRADRTRAERGGKKETTETVERQPGPGAAGGAVPGEGPARRGGGPLTLEGRR